MVWQLVSAMFGWSPTMTVDFYDGAYRPGTAESNWHVTFTAPYPDWASQELLSDPRVRMRLVRDYDALASSDEWPHHAGMLEGWLYRNASTTAPGPWYLIEGGTYQGSVDSCASVTLLDDHIHLELGTWKLLDWHDRGGTVGEVSGRDDWHLEVSLGSPPHSPHPDRCNANKTTN